MALVVTKTSCTAMVSLSHLPFLSYFIGDKSVHLSCTNAKAAQKLSLPKQGKACNFTLVSTLKKELLP